MTCRAFVQPPLYVGVIDSIIDNQTLTSTYILLVHLSALENGRNIDMGKLKKYRGDIISEFCTKIFKAKFMRCVNKVLFEMVK